ncbi:MAG: hypothetical protein Q8Q36_01630 [bacterium]|nr:hypothetical protein [bacterium]
MYRNIVIVRSDDDVEAFNAMGFEDVFLIPKRARRDKPIHLHEAEDIVNMVVKFGTVFLVAKDTPEGRKFVLEAFRLIGAVRSVFWLKVSGGQSLADLSGMLPAEMHIGYPSYPSSNRVPMTVGI